MEKEIINKYLPSFEFSQIGSEMHFNGWYSPKAGGKRFKLKLSLSPHFPDHMPELYVVNPNPLWMHNNQGTINSLGTSHSFHTLSNGTNGSVKICHFTPDNWDATKTCMGVFSKGFLWSEAYIIHLISGMCIDDIIKKIKGRLQNARNRES